MQQGFLVGWWKVCGFDGILGWRLVLGLMEGSAQADTATASGATNRPCSASSGSSDEESAASSVQVAITYLRACPLQTVLFRKP